MKHRVSLWLGFVTLLVVAAAPGKTFAGPSSDNLLDLAANAAPSVSLGLGVSPLHWELIAPLPGIPASTAVESQALGDRGAVSLDVKLKWPGAEHGLEPYLAVGPALVVEQPHDPGDLMRTPGDPTVRLGAKAGAGFNWRLTKGATLFGSYDVTTTGVDAFTSSRTKAPASGIPTEHELLYGVRFRY